MDLNTLLLRFSEMFTEFKIKFLEILPNLFLSLIVLLIGYLIARIVKYLVIRLIRYLQKLLTENVGGSLQQYIKLDQSANFIGTVFFWIVLISTFVLITDILDWHIITNWMESILQYSPNLLAAMLIVLIAILVGRAVAEIISSVSVKVGLAYGSTLGRLAYYLILITAIFIAIDQIGIEVSILINLINIVLAALLFGAALAFGLGAKTAVSNILAGFYVRKTYKVGDHIKIDDIDGKIFKIDSTSVVLETKTGQAIIPTKTFNESKSQLIKHN